MDFRDSVSVDLPAPRDDEPAGLRQDILDELADHLACSYNRELLRGADPGEARRRAIERFGNPAAVARRLWLDAMKGKIMVQRVVIATCLVVTLASLSVAGVMWRQTAQAHRDSSRAVADAVRLVAEQNEKAQAGQQAMLKQLQDMSETMRSTRSLEWNPVRFQLNEEKADGPPVAGASISLRAFPAGGQGQGPDVGTRVTDGSGVADFGVLRPGGYSFEILRVWDRGSTATSGSLKIEPGSQIHQQVVCPRVPLNRADVRIRMAWPDDFVKEKLQLYASFALKPVSLDRQSWKITDVRPLQPRAWITANTMQPATRSVLYGAGPPMLRVFSTNHEGPFIWAASPGDPGQGLLAELHDSKLREIKEPAGTIEWEQGSYQLSRVMVLQPGPPGDGQTGKRRFNIVLVSDPPDGTVKGGRVDLWVSDSPPMDEHVEGPRAKSRPLRKGGRGNAGGNRFTPLRLHPREMPELTLPEESWSNETTDFEARPGQVNEWTIPLPDGLIEGVRKRLKTMKEPPRQTDE
jgi:hypothetical protein